MARKKSIRERNAAAYAARAYYYSSPTAFWREVPARTTFVAGSLSVPLWSECSEDAYCSGKQIRIPAGLEAQVIEGTPARPLIRVLYIGSWWFGWVYAKDPRTKYERY